MTMEQRVRAAVNEIATATDPEQVVLFGSVVRGTAGLAARRRPLTRTMRVELKVENAGDRTLVEHRKPEQFDVRRMSDDGIIGALLPRTS